MSKQTQRHTSTALFLNDTLADGTAVETDLISITS